MPLRSRIDGEKDREISEFLLRACHDLRSSLRGIRVHSELLLKDSETPRIADLEQRLGFIVEGAKKIDLLAEGLSSYSIALQIEESSFQSTRTDVLLRNVLQKLQKELRDNQAEVTYGDLPRVSADPDRLIQVFENLLRNALRHRGEAAPHIHISADSDVGRWRFAVRDNGPGVEAAYLESIFKPFERVHRKENEGVGLGLAICKAIVERHGGRMWAESEAGAGSTFFFTLPAEGV
jgi:signal transduction histidine kinase